MRQLNGAHKEPQTVYPLIDFCTDLHMAAHHEFLGVLGVTLAWLGNFTSVEHPLTYILNRLVIIPILQLKIVIPWSTSYTHLTLFIQSLNKDIP